VVELFVVPEWIIQLFSNQPEDVHSILLLSRKGIRIQLGPWIRIRIQAHRKMVLPLAIVHDNGFPDCLVGFQDALDSPPLIKVQEYSTLTTTSFSVLDARLM
jgi:hypothetical protein